MSDTGLPLDQIIQGECIQALEALPEKSVDLIFADPPYNLQLRRELWRPNMTRVDAVDEEWDRFSDFQAYDDFTRRWLSACRRVLKDTGSLWVIGTYHNIFRIGAILQDTGYWILNDVTWIKTNPMPNFRGVRFTNAHETLIWASKSRGSRYTFNHHAMKALNDDRQMRSDWILPICSGAERIRTDGKKAHSAQKPEALLYRVLLASSKPGDVVLDPFFGSGTTGAVAKKLGRRWIGIEKDADYVQVARERIERIAAGPTDPAVLDVRGARQREPRVRFAALLETGLLQPGRALYFQGDRDKMALVKPDGRLRLGDFEGSIHQAGEYLMQGSPCNGWEHWYYETGEGELRKIDELRRSVRHSQS